MYSGRSPELCLILRVFPVFKISSFYVFWEIFREIMSVLCPLQVTVMGPSTKDVSDKREEVKEQRPTL